jgi:hypothetical protein
MDTFMAVGLRFAVLLTLNLLLTFSAAFAQSQSGSPLPFVIIAAGSASGVLEPAQLVIRDEAGWRALWYQHAGAGAGPPPSVDFRRDMVVGIFAGKIPEPASMSIVRVTRAPDRLVVWYTLRATRPLAANGTGLSSTPFNMITLEQSNVPVDFSQIKTPPMLRLLPEPSSRVP